MALEAGLRRAVLEKLAPLHAVAIESPIEPGTPDVNCTAGWIELKHLDRWPARADTVVVPKHFKPEQRLWLKRRCVVGRAWLLLRVGHEWCLLWGNRAADELGTKLVRSELQCDVKGGPCSGTLDDDHREWHQRYGWDAHCGSSPAVQRYWRMPPTSAELIKALVVQRWLQ